MNPNLSTSYVALQTDRSRLAARAEHGWQAEQAAASGPHRLLSTTMRQWAGTFLILAGERLRRISRQTGTQTT